MTISLSTEHRLLQGLSHLGLGNSAAISLSMEHRLDAGPFPLGTWQLCGYLIVYGASPHYLGLSKSAVISLSTEHRLAARLLPLGTRPLCGYLLVYGTSPRKGTSPIWEPQIASPTTHINEGPEPCGT
ncbi:hypothetical protein Fot_38251 [Forsythia ovata]|uniref:Uncharacterized protein n=1 Tax=Forsythia ovata TaxID=205694 RepID=A0ABD1S195_9LAMI